MQRWFFLGNGENEIKRDFNNEFLAKNNDDDKSNGANEQKHRWLFRVRLNDDAYLLHPDDKLCVTGNCPELGNWNPDKCIVMDEEPVTNNNSKVWSKQIMVPLHQAVEYRYCMATVIDSNRKIIRLWETNIQPRVIQKDSNVQNTLLIDEFGYYDGKHNIERGWLSHDTVIQLKLFNNPLTLYKPKLAGRKIYIKVTPVCLLRHQSGDYNLPETCDESLSMDTQEMSNSTPIHTLTEVASLNEYEKGFHLQEQFGHPYMENDFVIFQISVLELQNVAYLIDYYVYSSKSEESEPPYHLGFSYILPSALKNSEGQMIVPITSVKQRPLGQLNLEYLVIYALKSTPSAINRMFSSSLSTSSSTSAGSSVKEEDDELIEDSYNCDMRVSFARHWNKSWSGLDVAHRGLGSNFVGTQRCADVRENTIASLKTAVSHGADFVEFDVQLSKDMIPVIYHDFHVFIALKRKRNLEDTDMLELPVKDLTLEQLHLLKVYHLEEGKDKTPRFFDEDLEEHQPFPTLKQVLDVLDPHVGFNIEIKWTMKLIDGSFELNNPKELNTYLDIILNTVLKHGGQRRVIFSCFHPDICTMVRLKQNKYPVIFLTVGQSIRYTSYFDPRCFTIEAAVQHAKISSLLGISVHSEDVLRDSSQIKYALNAGMIIFCWGWENNDSNTIKFLKQLGIHGVIYDKINEFGSKEVKESIFLVEARKSQCKELIAIAEAAAASNQTTSNTPTSHVPTQPVESLPVEVSQILNSQPIILNEQQSITSLESATSLESLSSLKDFNDKIQIKNMTDNQVWGGIPLKSGGET